ncbi:MAG: DUF4445 domain-containing protein [Chloroflexi bacterium]|nr:DUF4445 domain-containing protein [Chloroflexota bacterium]
MKACETLGIQLERVCGEKATCGKCKVRVEEGFHQEIYSSQKHLSPMVEEEREFFSQHSDLTGYRLACLARVMGDVVIFVPEDSRLTKHIAWKGLTERFVSLLPVVRKYYVEVPPFGREGVGREGARADFESLVSEITTRFALSDLRADHYVLRALPSLLRETEGKVTVTVWMNKEIVKIEPGYWDVNLGVAIDVGTTSIAAYLCDLVNGQTLAAEVMSNPQIRFGEDVISRISYAILAPNGLEELQIIVIDGLNTLLSQVTKQAGFQPKDISDVCIVGNTCMHHFLLGLTPYGLSRAPYRAVVQRALDIKARELGLDLSPSVYAYFLPTVASFVGADAVGVMLAMEPNLEAETVLTIDLGTNGELILSGEGRLLCTSCACGPAFEGGQVSSGMRATAGAIEKVRIDPDTLEVKFQVVGSPSWSDGQRKTNAKGICGSGIIDVVAEMLRAGIIHADGRFDSSISSPRLRQTAQGTSVFVIAWAHETALDRDITISNSDVRAIQLAKAAVYAGASVLLRKVGKTLPDKVLLAGSFGTSLDVDSCRTIGLFPGCDEVYAVGNAAGNGARLCLLNREKRLEAESMVQKVEHLELAKEKEFSRIFLEALSLGQYKPLASTKGSMKDL